MPSKRLDRASLDGECIEVAREKLVQVEELAALALPAHPHALPRVVNTVTMQQKKNAITGRLILFV